MPKFKTKPREVQARICQIKEDVWDKTTTLHITAMPGNIIVKDEERDRVFGGEYFWQDHTPAEAKAREMKKYWDEHYGPNRAKQGAGETAKAQEQDSETDPE